MAGDLKLRYPSPIERWQSYIPLAAWPFLWLVRYGWWTWVIAWAPAVLLSLFDRAWASRAPLFVRARRGGGRVELALASGAVVDAFVSSVGHGLPRPGAGASFSLAEVDAVTVVADGAGAAKELRVDRKTGRALLFSVVGPADAAATAEALGVDLGTARRRYRAASLAARAAVLAVVGFALMGWVIFGKPGHVAAVWIVRYLIFVFLPQSVLMAVPTWIEVARDGVAWRWLFVRRYVGFSDVLAVRAHGDVPEQRAVSMDIVVKGGKAHRLVLGQTARGALADIRRAFEAFVARGAAPELEAVDAWLPRVQGEDGAAWLRRIRAMSAGDGVYRSVPRDNLWKIAEDPAADATLRCGALIVLCASDDARRRVRALALSTAHPGVVKVAEALADGAEEEEIVKRLEGVARR